MQDQATRYLPGGSSRGTVYFDPYPFFVGRGEGHYIYDVDGNKYLDFMINATSLIMGHAHPAITDALCAQARKGLAFSGPVEPQVKLADGFVREITICRPHKIYKFWLRSNTECLSCS